VVKDDEQHGSASKEDGQRVELGVCDHIVGLTRVR
jgi:hypothetical protein